MSQKQQSSPTTTTTLAVKYASPSNEAFTITTQLPSTTTPSTTTTTNTKTHLRALRAAVLDAQTLINKELTARMEQDAQTRGHGGGAGLAASEEEDKEEENYGEEVQDDEA